MQKKNMTELNLIAIRGLYHIQNVNGLHSRMKYWSNRFKGF